MPEGILNQIAEQFEKQLFNAIGNGETRSAPIHVPELAGLMLAELGPQSNTVIEVGGPEDLSWRDICALCFEVQGLPSQIQGAPVGLCRFILMLLRPFTYRFYAMGRLLLFMSTHDVCTPHRGRVRPQDYLAGTLD